MAELQRMPPPLPRSVIIPRRRLRLALIPIIIVIPILRIIRNHQRVGPHSGVTAQRGAVVIEADLERGLVDGVGPARDGLVDDGLEIGGGALVFEAVAYGLSLLGCVGAEDGPGAPAAGDCGAGEGFDAVGAFDEV